MRTRAIVVAAVVALVVGVTAPAATALVAFEDGDVVEMPDTELPVDEEGDTILDPDVGIEIPNVDDADVVYDGACGYGEDGVSAGRCSPPTPQHVLRKTSGPAYTVKTSTTYYTCDGNTGDVCTYSQSTAVTRTIQTDLTMTRAWVASKIGISSASTYSWTGGINVKITSETKDLVKFHPAGNKYGYVIIRRYQKPGINPPQYTVVATSPTKYAFNPTGLAYRTSNAPG